MSQTWPSASATVIWVALIIGIGAVIRGGLIPASRQHRVVPVRAGETGSQVPADQNPRREATTARMGWAGRVVVPPDHVRNRAPPVRQRRSGIPQGHAGQRARRAGTDAAPRTADVAAARPLLGRVRAPGTRSGGHDRARGGHRRPEMAGRPAFLGRHVECDNFQDGQRFLREGGEQGRQVATLAGDSCLPLSTRGCSRSSSCRGPPCRRARSGW